MGRLCAQVCKAPEGQSSSCEGTLKGGLKTLYDSFDPPTRDSDAAGCEPEQVGLSLEAAVTRRAEEAAWAN